MTTSDGLRVLDRKQAGGLLAFKLQQYANSEALVVGIPRGGVVVAATVAHALNLKLQVIPCRRIKHPADNTKSIGSVSVDEVVINDKTYDIPQDYISHQIALLRNSLRNETQVYCQDSSMTSIRYKTVIVVDDILQSGSTMLACLKSIGKQQPLKLIVAVPFVSAEAARVVGGIADELVFDQMFQEIRSACQYYNEFPEVDEGEVIALIKDSMKEFQII